MKDIYLKNGYLNYRAVLGLQVSFIFIVGGRGTGKTYGALKYVHDNDKRFMFMRRTQKQIKQLRKPAFNPFKKLGDNEGFNVELVASDEVTTIIERKEEIDEVLGYACAVSDLANMRGIDASDVDVIIYDEFIPMRSERVAKGEELSFLDIYESINRNRELDGYQAVQVLCLANSNEMANPVFMELNLVRTAEKMKKKGERVKVDKQRGYAIIYLDDSKISEQKKQTALYKLLGDNSNYTKMSLSNDFVIEDDDLIQSKNLKEYKPFVSIGELTIYKHKNKREYYASNFKAGACRNEFSADSKGIDKFRKQYIKLYYTYLDRRIIFEDYLSLKLFTKYLNI